MKSVQSGRTPTEGQTPRDGLAGTCARRAEIGARLGGPRRTWYAPCSPISLEHHSVKLQEGRSSSARGGGEASAWEQGREGSGTRGGTGASPQLSRQTLGFTACTGG